MTERHSATGWIIETGGEKWESKETDPVMAFKEWADSGELRELGVLFKALPLGAEHSDTTTLYFDCERILRSLNIWAEEDGE